jgi:hypothetical protein
METGTEYHWTYNVIKELEKIGYMSEGIIVDVSGMFELWKKRPNTSKIIEYHIQDVDNFVMNVSLDYAATTYYAENRLGQYILPRILELYVHEYDIKKWHDQIMEIGYLGKGNLKINVSDEHIFWHKKRMEGLTIVSIQQVIVDLLREGGITIEAAENLIERYYGK